MRVRCLLLFFMTVFMLLSVSSAQTEDQPSWEIQARFLVVNNCSAGGCSCLLGGGPQNEYCRALGVMQVTDGFYDGVSLSGQNIGMIVEYANKEKRYQAYYIDENANDNVKTALRALLSEAPFGIVGEGFSIKEALISVHYADGKKSSFAIGDYGTMVLNPMMGSDGKSQTKIASPTYIFPVKEIYLYSANGRYLDYGKELVLRGNSGEISMLTLKGGRK